MIQMAQIKNIMKFFIIVFIFFFNNVTSQTNLKKECFSLNPFIDVFITNLIDKDVNLDKNYLSLISLKDKDGNYNIDLELTSGNIDNLKIKSSKELKKKYGSITILLIGKTEDDLKFLKNSTRKSNRVFLNKNRSKNNTSFYDEDYVWSVFFNSKKELINFYIPEEKEFADKIFNQIKNNIRINPDFKKIDCNCL